MFLSFLRAFLRSGKQWNFFLLRALTRVLLHDVSDETFPNIIFLGRLGKVSNSHCIVLLLLYIVLKRLLNGGGWRDGLWKWDIATVTFSHARKSPRFLRFSYCNLKPSLTFFISANKWQFKSSELQWSYEIVD